MSADTSPPARTQLAVIGAEPAGLLLEQRLCLRQRGQRRPRAADRCSVEQRIH